MSSSATEQREELIERLLAASEDELSTLAKHSPGQTVELAEALRGVYFASYSTDTVRAAAAAHTLHRLAAASGDPITGALALWISGLAALQLDGQVERALQLIDEAAVRLTALGRELDAAATQVGKVFALALIGRYDEALECGLRARTVLLAHGDTLSAGRIELNLGNLCYRRDQYAEAEQFYRDARERFAGAADTRMLVAVDNGLANVLSQQLQIPAAAALYEQALAGAAALGLEAIQADIECNLGGLALYTGRFDAALALLERSRRRYAALDRPHESALSELELADAYTELNLAAEAATIYARVSATFAALDMHTDQARALLNHGRACIQLGRADEAWALLDEARTLYNDQGNGVGVGLVALAEAQLAFMQGDSEAIVANANQAIPVFEQAGARREAILARWLAAEGERACGRITKARPALETALADAETHAILQVAQRALISLARLALAEGDRSVAERELRRAVAVAEARRAPLPADEIRAAFARETLAPYSELASLCLSDPAGPRVAEALLATEAGRARALLEMLGDAPRLPELARGPADTTATERIRELRVELNWLYSRLARPLEPDESPATRALQHDAALQREQEIAELRRRSAPGELVSSAEPLDLAALQRALGHDTALVTYTVLGDELLAFVVTDEGVSVEQAGGTLRDVETSLSRLRFQLGTLGYGANTVRGHLPLLAERTRRHLAALYDLLLRPFEGRLGARRLVVVPHSALHYVPFHALHDGAAYVIERREVCAVPSAGVLLHCLDRPRVAVRNALIVGVADERAPRVRDEAAGLKPLFASATLLLDNEASASALSAAAPAADLVHLACHGQFRADNPLFSALRLGDGWLTVHEVYRLDLHCQLVTLSACETGVSAVAPGDELLGLARGFFTAGAPSLCVSLWAVDDEATATLMNSFYRHLLAGTRPAAALRAAQLELLRHRPHPFFWASFALLGRW